MESLLEGEREGPVGKLHRVSGGLCLEARVSRYGSFQPTFTDVCDADAVSRKSEGDPHVIPQ